MNKRETITKAILFEIKEKFKSDKKSHGANTDIFDEVMSFYIRFNERFKYNVEYITELDNMNRAIKNFTLEEVDEWSLENDILYSVRQKNQSIFANKEILIFSFTKEEDAIAFKLRWL